MPLNLTEVFTGDVVNGGTYYLNTTWTALRDDFGLVYMTNRLSSGTFLHAMLLPVQDFAATTAPMFGQDDDWTLRFAQAVDSEDRGLDVTVDGTDPGGTKTLTVYGIPWEDMAKLSTGTELYDQTTARPDMVTPPTETLDNAVTWGDVRTNHGGVFITYKWDNTPTQSYTGDLFVFDKFTSGEHFMMSLSAIRGLSLEGIDDGDGNFDLRNHGGTVIEGPMVIYGVDINILPPLPVLPDPEPNPTPATSILFQELGAMAHASSWVLDNSVTWADVKTSHTLVLSYVDHNATGGNRHGRMVWVEEQLNNDDMSLAPRAGDWNYLQQLADVDGGFDMGIWSGTDDVSITLWRVSHALQ